MIAKQMRPMIYPSKSYPVYKRSSIEWLGDVPKHWLVLPIRALMYEVNERDKPNEPLLSVTIKQGVIQQNELLANSSKRDNSKLDRSNYKLTKPNDIIYNKMRAWQGAIGASEFTGIVSPAYVVERPRNGVKSRYCHYLLRTPAFAKECERWSYGIASDMWSLRPEHFRLIHICVPPPDEQSAIVSFLDRTDRRIRRYIHSKQTLLSLMEEQKHAVIHQAITGRIDVRTGRPYPAYKLSGVEWLGDVPEHWEIRRLRNVADMRVSNVDKHVKDGENPVRLCNYVDVYNNDYINKRMDFMHATATYEEIERFRLEKDDVLITKDSETWDDIGVPALVTEPACDLISGYHLALLRPRPDKLAGAFLLRALESKGLAYQFHVEAKGVTRYGLSHAGITSVWLPVPSLFEQTAIVHYLDEFTANIETAINRMRRQIELFQEYRTRLVSDVVTGKLDVREAAADLPSDTESMDDPSETGQINDTVSQVAG